MEKYTQRNLIIPVILAGGSGTRLWPISRESYPKQFCHFFNEHSLLQSTALRAQHLAPNDPLIIITNEKYYFLCQEQLEAINISNVHYILEPCSRNTAPAIALAASYIDEHIGPEANLFVMPSDHYLPDSHTLKQQLEQALRLSNNNCLMVFGIQPTAPKTGYGYIEKGKHLHENIFQVNQFVEKPTLAVAERYIASKNFYWNSGMFLFNAQCYLKELDLLAPDISKKCQEAFRASKIENGFFRPGKAFEECRSGSIDYEIMEKTSKAVIMPLQTQWSDLGCWASMTEIAEADADGNVCQGNVMVTHSKNSLVSSENKRVVAIGLQDHVVVNTDDAVLVANKAYSQELKEIIAQLKLEKDVTATEHKRIYRPWGFYESISIGAGFQVKHLQVNPGAKLSLQLHQHRSEHWVIIAGDADIINGENKYHLKTGQSTYVPKLTKHRLCNPYKVPLSVIEVQIGDYLGEDDIIRFEDHYGRNEKIEVSEVL